MLPVIRVAPRDRLQAPNSGVAARGLAGVLACACLVGGMGCSRSHGAAPVAPGSPPPPGIVAVYPAPRSTGVFYGTDIWADFEQALDPSTVNDRTVFLKLDTQRIPATVLYDAALHRIRVIPRQRLALRRTHTVEISTNVVDILGGRLSDTYFWQFTTNSVRLPVTPSPDSTAARESPFAPLQWLGTEASAGTIAYRLYVGTDSALVATRTIQPIEFRERMYYLPRVRWGEDRTVYWTVDTENLTTTETISGPLWRFATMPAGVPLDSLRLPASQWGYIDIPGVVRCGGVLACGPSYWCAAQWPFETLPHDLKVADGYIILSPATITDLSKKPSLWFFTLPWLSCDIGRFGPPFTDESQGRLADAGTTSVGGGQSFFFSSDGLISHFAGAVRAGGFRGYLIRCEAVTRFNSPGASPTLVLFYYRDNAEGLTAKAHHP